MSWAWLNPALFLQFKNKCLKSFKEVLQAQCATYHLRCIKDSSRLLLYANVKTIFGMEKYLDHIPDFKIRNAISKLRLVSHNLEIETGRWAPRITRENRYCTSCNSNTIGDEYHIVMKCVKFETTRFFYLPFLSETPCNLFHFNKLFQCRDIEVTINLGKYLCNTFKVLKQQKLQT